MGHRPRVLTVVGARPQFVKLAPLSRALRSVARQTLVHTGQHYDREMSADFFEALGLPRVDFHLGIGSASHGAMTGRMTEAIEAVLLEVRPELVLVLGDTNSTLAGALAAAKLGITVAHVEAGLRSGDMRMPEEINRRLVDHLSGLLLCPTPHAVRNLGREGIRSGVHLVGDVMKDALWDHWRQVRAAPALEGEPARKAYYLATVHRQENVDDPGRLRGLVETLESLPLPTLLPLHPRTAARLRQLGHSSRGSLRILKPLGYPLMMRLAEGARAVLTDSGGLQKEAALLGTPCLTLRDRTEWVETVRCGANRLVGTDGARIRAALAALERRPPRWSAARLYGKGRAAPRIAAILSRFLARRTGSGRPTR
jgi:UDP-N-acetylglucosamine 2-epimerase